MMKKQKDNYFSNKFQLLCSQESKEDIVWSLSDSSDYDHLESEKVHNLSSKHQSKKRKRKKKVLKNISNLNITILDTKNRTESRLNEDKDAIEDEKNSLCDNVCDGKISPIMVSQCQQNYSVGFTSPIISSNNLNQQNKGTNLLKSPILVLKTACPTNSPKVRKNLFNDNSRTNKDFVTTIHKSKTLEDGNKINAIKKYDSNVKRIHSMYSEDSNFISKTNNSEFKANYKSILSHRGIDNDREIQYETREKQHEKNNILDNSMDLLRPANIDLDLVKKVQTYFDSHFSSESASQHSINDTPTPKSSSKTSDDVDISNTITQAQSNRNSSESIKENVLENVKPKKFRYKKDGLAYRLNSILKKHNANISLWQHERFLAANSNFVIPKGDHLIFHVRNVQFRYGCYLLEAKDVENYGFLILINNEYVTDNDITKDVIIKVYEPYKILEFNDHFKVVINVCKFECISVCS